MTSTTTTTQSTIAIDADATIKMDTPNGINATDSLNDHTTNSLVANTAITDTTTIKQDF